jgi:hypothetical protein
VRIGPKQLDHFCLIEVTLSAGTPPRRREIFRLNSDRNRAHLIMLGRFSIQVLSIAMQNMNK